MSGAAMAAFLKSRDVWGESLKSFLLDQAERLKRHALDLCTREGRPYEYLSHATKKEDLARKIAERAETTQGLVCVLSVVEPCRTFSLVWSGRSFNPLSRNERMLFEVLLAGEHVLHGFTNRDVRQKLGLTAYPLAPDEDRQPSPRHSVVPPAPCVRLHRQNPTRATLARFPR